MPSNSWKALPNTMMKDVCPQPASNYACWSVVGAWSGGSFDEKRNQMIIFGGGHGDSWYNNVFSFDLVQMRWSRLTEMPAGASSAAPAPWQDSRLETCGYYPKGTVSLPADVMLGNYVDPAKCFYEPVMSQLDFQQPRSAHTYGGFYVDRLRDRYCSIAKSFYPSAQASSPVSNCFDPVSGKWVRNADTPANVGGRGQTALDAAGNVWSIPGQSGNLARFNPLANAWTAFGYVNYAGGGGTDIDRKRNQLYVLFPVAGQPWSVRRWDLGTLTTSSTYATVPTSGTAPVTTSDARPGFVYADNHDKFFAWSGGRDVHTLNPATGAWTRLAATGDDPGAQQNTGTFGRFRYVPSRGVFILVNDTNKNVYIYKP